MESAQKKQNNCDFITNFYIEFYQQINSVVRSDINTQLNNVKWSFYKFSIKIIEHFLLNVRTYVENIWKLLSIYDQRVVAHSHEPGVHVFVPLCFELNSGGQMGSLLCVTSSVLCSVIRSIVSFLLTFSFIQRFKLGSG